ncbi:MAG: hypothetical protein ABW000_20325 [Actinoplanes sp.]
MATALIPVDQAVSPLRVARVLTVTARLLPDEIIAARRTRRTRTWVLVVVALVACLCAAWFVYAGVARQDADEQLTEATAEVTDLQREQRKHADVVQVQNDAAQLTTQLETVMADDLDWAALFDTLRTIGGSSGIKIAGVTGKLDKADGTDDTAVNPLPNVSTSVSIGSLVVTGTGPDKAAIAAYADALGKQSVVADPYITSVTTDEKGLATFSLTVDITKAALCGRFGDKCKSAGGN